jgi:tetratricopeptide (TPR) repeat protein
VRPRRVGWALGVVIALALVGRPARAQDDADRAWDRGDTESAWTLYSRRLAADSGDQVALHRLGLMAGWAGRYDQSLRLLDRLVAIAPNNFGAAVDRARVRAWQGRLSDALRDIDAVLARAPGYAPAREARALFLSWTGEYSQAIAVYDSVLAQDSTDFDALAGIARVRGWQGHLKDTERRWRQLLARDATSTTAAAGLAQTLRWEGREAAALGVLHRATAAAPNDLDLRSEQRMAQLALQPRSASSFGYESDSDENGISTLGARAAWRPTARVELRASGYYRWLSLGGAAPQSRDAYGGILEVWTQAEPGWEFSAGLGASGSDVAGADAVTRYALRASSPRREPVVGTLSLIHDAVDGTAPLVQNRVTVRQVALDLRASPGGWRLSGAFTLARFEGSEPNNRTGGAGAVSRVVLHDFTVGGAARVFGFQKDLNDGYFDPDLYALIEAPARWQHTFHGLIPAIEVAPGLQKVSGSAFGAAVRLQGELRYTFGPDREIAVVGGYSTLGVALFASDVGNYKYRFVTVSGAWRF